MSNERLLVMMVDESLAAAELAQSLIHQVTAHGCVLKPAALPTLVKCRQKLSAAHNVSLELERRATVGK